MPGSGMLAFIFAVILIAFTAWIATGTAED